LKGAALRLPKGGKFLAAGLTVRKRVAAVYSYLNDLFNLIS
jgi:hypothetical protein